MYAIYAFCREVDDIADEEGSVPEKLAGLKAWRDEVDRIYLGTASTPIGRALLQCLNYYAFNKTDFVAVIEGMQTDAVESLRLADLPALQLYCDQVACAVGRLSVKVFGINEPDGSALAKSLGEALQLTNILRDVDEDAERNHVYLPNTMLKVQGIDTSNTATMVRHPNLANVCNELSDIAAQRFREAEEILNRNDPSKARPAMIMMRVYRRIFDRLVARGWTPPRDAVRISKFEKLGLALSALTRSI